ncbi:MAG TPA: 2-C-methyl-D-erythritol 4-phosphate cytidylyltransferase [Nocardioides sp.]|uniref:2-C-methyl-D-erythritol 4-phosphate cytidylyltransferase n=1 Tax=Nocardioides sp. TaxID=35761 RepID=UPI002B8946DC|nr:2-C-methyl-D-erythritol 4-phosphate cytidylyltransferase [Nocardioides sp.]HQR27724.1 2-C-methyl-D-erythritol 4-phosphate cytidylyltransferase [Nocardioides sp.]
MVEQDRGDLPFALVHGRPLVACAGLALAAAGVTLVDLPSRWADVRDAGVPLVLHDPLCPMTPPDFLAACAQAARDGAVVVAVRPVTDTVKVVRDGLVGATVDREALRIVTSPVVLPAAVCAALPGPPTADLAALATRLRRDHPVRLVTAPPEGRRVSTLAELQVLEALTAPD